MRPAPLLSGFEKRRRARRSRTVTLSRPVVQSACAALVLLLGWSCASLWYFTSRDEIALRFLERQASLRRDYETRIGELRVQLEKAGERGPQRDGLETRLNELLARQEALEKRQQLVHSLAGRVGDLSLAPATEASQGSGLPPAASSYVPAPPPADPYQLRLRQSDATPSSTIRQSADLGQRLDGAANGLAALETRQLRGLESIVQSFEIQSAALQAALRKVGLDPQAIAPSLKQGVGGPLVPAKIAAQHESGMFGILASHAEVSARRLEILRRSTAALPFEEPVAGEIDLSSGFGYRIDPFTRSPAVHTGLDIKAEYGSPVYAAGAGRVVSAEFSGAYGNMVEIDHGSGVTSRYGHLSSMAVSVGDEVEARAVVGRVGSTGRSTGPHLHYETRVRGDAVDPQRFLSAGASVGPVSVSFRRDGNFGLSR